ncbi:MAG: alpha/beta fold hydrolase [Methanocella sp.]
MATLRIASDFEIYYEVDEHTAPWTEPDTVLMLHGNCESGRAWYGWIPHLAPRYRIVRPDMRGFGRSTPVSRDFPLTAEVIVGDYVALMDHLGIERFHIVAAKIGGTVARVFAALYPDRVQTLSVIGTPPPYRPDAIERLPAWIKDFDENGVEPWARKTMASRLGASMPPEAVEWWIRYMGRTSRESQIAYAKHLACADIRRYLPLVKCPTLVITTEESGLASVEQNRAWQEQIPNSRLLVLRGNSYHAAVTHARQCARAVLDFIAPHSSSARLGS